MNHFWWIPTRFPKTLRQKSTNKCTENSCGTVSCAKSKKSMQNDQLSHRRRDQLFKNRFSNALERFRQARSAKSKCCDQCYFFGWNGVTVYSEKPKGVTQRNLKVTASRDVWHFPSSKSWALCYTTKRGIKAESTFACGVCQALRQKDPAKARRDLQRSNQQANANRSAQRG